MRGAFSVDLRSLALARIALGTLAAADILVRASQFNVFYAESGMLPLSAVSEFHAYQWLPSVYLISGSAAWTILLFACTFAAACCVAAGYRTRAATFALWFLLLSLHQRVAPIVNGGDNALRLVLFWCLFLPWGDRFSVDAARSQGDSPRRVVSPATAALCLQIALIYWISVLQKLRSPDWIRGEVVWNALNQQTLVTDVGSWIAAYPAWCRILNYAVILFETAGPLLLLACYARRRLRIGTIAAFWLMHLSFLLCMHMGIFPLISCAVLLVFWPFDRGESAPTDLLRRQPWVSAAAAIFLLYMIWSGVSVFPKLRAPMPHILQAAGTKLGIHQRWAFFMPSMKRDVWYLFSGKTEDGGRVNALPPERTAALEARPPYALQYACVSQRNYMKWFLFEKKDYLRKAYAAYACERLNGQAGPRVKEISMTAVFRNIGDKRAPEEITELGIYPCD